MICNGRKLVSEPEWTSKAEPAAEISDRLYSYGCAVDEGIR